MALFAGKIFQGKLFSGRLWKLISTQPAVAGKSIGVLVYRAIRSMTRVGREATVAAAVHYMLSMRGRNHLLSLDARDSAVKASQRVTRLVFDVPALKVEPVRTIRVIYPFARSVRAGDRVHFVKGTRREMNLRYMNHE